MQGCGSFPLVESASGAGESSGVGHTLAAVLGGVLGVLAVISVFTIAVIFGMLGTLVYRVWWA